MANKHQSILNGAIYGFMTNGLLVATTCPTK